ncbi:MAG: ammonium transporter [Phycisphaerales bacterium]|jgi:Amt family ammonium transporter|nr:ammonium transporter [Phycisphaerales bacterium]
MVTANWVRARRIGRVAMLACAMSAPAALAQDGAPAAAKIDTGDTAWVLVSTALVLLMTIPGLALFYGGLVRAKNVLSVLMHCLFCAALVSVLWVIVGYGLAFGPSVGGWIGELGSFAFLRGTEGTNHALAPTVPHGLFAAYQMTFAIITPALIAGAYAERLRFAGFALITALWLLLLYAPLAHWVWGGGWIGTKLGALDFAGGTVVHISSGVSALVAALYLKQRAGYGVEPMPPHNLPFTVMGAGLLWVGWFGFNAGSALGANELASTALINTNTAAAAAALAWMLAERLKHGHATILGAASGAVAGLVVITPGAGFVPTWAALVMGLLGGVVCFWAVSFKARLKYDDALDVVGVHFVGGILGALLTGVFASGKVNSAIAALTAGGDAAKPTTLMGSMPGGLVDGHAGLIVTQGLAVVATIAFCGIGTWVILAIVDRITPLRAGGDEETIGMDLSQHRERGYALGGGEALAAAAVTLGEVRAASTPPGKMRWITIQMQGLAEAAVLERWRGLCQERPGTSAGAEFRTIYGQVSTVRGTTFRFRSIDGDSGGAAERERLRTALVRLFSDMGPVQARVIE